MSLARAEHSPQRFYSMSSRIRKERDVYFDMLEATQKQDSGDVTPWLRWFLDCLDRAIAEAETTLATVLKKTKFWKDHADSKFNQRQRDIINRLFNGFEGKLNSSKCAMIEKRTPDTALRDITEFVERGILKKEAAGGRSTSYDLRD